MGNLRSIENVVKHGGLPAVVCINRFSYDSDAEVELVRQRSLAAGAMAAEVSEVWEHGGAGGEALARAVVAAADAPNTFDFLYKDDAPIGEKINAVAVNMYGADGVDIAPEARRQIAQFTEWGLGHLPVCIAKTNFSLSADANKKGRPTGFRVNVREVRPRRAASIAYLGEIRTMPGLPASGGDARRHRRHGSVMGFSGGDDLAPRLSAPLSRVVERGSLEPWSDS